MTITTRDSLINAIANKNSKFVIDKASIASQAAGTYVSLWRATGVPGQGSIPTIASVCDNLLAGSISFAQQVNPSTSYLAYVSMNCSNSTATMGIHDRLAHMGGLNGTVTTAQTVGIDFSSLLSTGNISDRIIDSNYSNICWWLEWYAATGATAVTATVSVTYGDGTTGNLTGASLAASRPASFMLSLNSLIPSASSGKSIRAVNSVTLSATTGTAGNFGVTATRPIAYVPTTLANMSNVYDWASLGLPEIKNSSCLILIQMTTTTSSGAVRGIGTIAHG